MKVSEVMTQDVETVGPEASLKEAAETMSRMDVGVLPAVDDGNRVIGVITDSDITIRAVALGKDPDNTQVRDAMSPGVKYVFDHDDVDDVAETMADLQIRRLPVVDREERLVGIVSLADIARDRRPRKAGEALQGISRPGGQHNA
jgi:CBS domain-containing protein